VGAPLEPTDARVLGLRGHTRWGVHGVGVGDRADHLLGRDRLGAVERHAEVAVGHEPLQVVHVIGDGAQRLGLAQQVEVPRRARPAATGQQRAVGVEHRLVVLVGDRPEQLALLRARVAEHRERLVGVGGDHHLVEALGLRSRDGDLHVVLRSRDRPHLRAEADALAEGGGERLHVARRPAHHGRPARAVAEAEHPVIGKELGQEAHREAVHARGVGRPHRRDLRDDQPLDERAREAVPAQELRKRFLPAPPALLARVGPLAVLAPEQPGELAVEAHEVEHHPLEARAHEVARLAEQAAGGARVLEVLILALHREAHVGRLRGHARAREQAGEVGVVAVVHHDETRIHVVGGVLGVHADRVGVAAHVVVRLIHHQLVLAVEHVRGHEPGHPRTHHRNPHRRPA
jgi:hypothetical protein